MHLRRLHSAFTLGFLGLAVTLSVQALAEVQMQDSRLWRRARVIAVGQQVLSFETSYQKTTDRFSQDGLVEPLGSNYKRAVTWNQLLKAESNQGKADLRAYMRNNRLSESDVAATSSYRIEREEVGFGANWAYGLTSRWMIGLRMPLTLRTTRVRQQIDMMPTLARGANQSSQKSILRLSNAEMQKTVKSLAETELANSGYDSVPDQKESWDWGDISLMSQELLYSSYNWNWSVQQMVRFPTAQNPSLTDYIQSSNDEGQTDLGFTSMLDYQRQSWLLGWRLGYVAQLPDTTRVHLSSDSTQIDPNVRRDLGDWIWSSLDGELRISRGFALNAEHSFLTKSRDSYKGDSGQAIDYKALENNTDEQLQQTRFGILYRLGPSTTRDGVMSRWVASIDYTYPWIGHNAMDASRTSLELINYF